MTRSSSAGSFRARAGFAAAFAIAVSAAAPARAGYGPGFEEETFCGGFVEPTAMAFLRPRILLVAEKSGAVYAVRNGVVRPSPILRVPAAIERERGLNGIAVDPDFRESGYVYVHYTADAIPRQNRVSRFLVSRSGVGPEEVLVDGLTSGAGIHNAGCLRFAADETLFFTAGDGGQATYRVQDLSYLNGKLCRIRRDGSAPADNPFVATPGARPEIFAYGFRNPWRCAIDPATGRVFVNDVGSAFYEEVNDALPGLNFGWPGKEGPRDGDGTTLPLITYSHEDSGAAVTGGAFYRGVQYPPSYDGNYFYMDFVRGTLTRAVLDGGGGVAALEQIATELPLPVDLIVGPDQLLYWLGFGDGNVYRIRYVGSENRRPSLRVRATPDAGTAPLPVTFSFAGSSDPDGDPLSFHVDFGDGESADTPFPSIDHVYTGAAAYDVVVTATDGRGGADTRTLRVDAANEPPVPVIDAPLDGAPYYAGELIPFSGHADDPEDGRLSESRLTFTIVFHHDDHTHPFLGPFAGQESGVFRVPRQGETATNVAYEIRLDATDSDGATRSASVFVRPRVATLRLVTDPPGLVVTLNGQPLATPVDVPSVAGFSHLLDAPSPQTGPLGGSLEFAGWTDTPDLQRRIVVPEAGVELTALFR